MIRVAPFTFQVVSPDVDVEIYGDATLVLCTEATKLSARTRRKPLLSRWGMQVGLGKKRWGMWVGILWGMLSGRYKNLASSMIRIMPDDARWIVNTVYIVFACMHIYTAILPTERPCCLILINPMSGLRILRVNSEIHSPSVLQAYSGHQIFGEVLAHSCPVIIVVGISLLMSAA